MKQRYSVFLRPWGVYYYQDNTTGKQETLKTRDKDEAYRLVAAKNEHEEAPAFSVHLARVYWRAGDPEAAKRTWQHVMDEIAAVPEPEALNRRWNQQELALLGNPKAAARIQRRVSLVGGGAKWRITNLNQVARAIAKW